MISLQLTDYSLQFNMTGIVIVLLHKAISNSGTHWSEHLSNTDIGCLYSEMLVGLILYSVSKQLYVLLFFGVFFAEYS